MTKMLEFTIDKFTFKVATDRQYSPEGVWVKQEGSQLRIGISDYLQGRSGDIAFAEIKSSGTVLAAGDEIAVIETIKVNISLGAPISGRIIEVNPAMQSTPEVINLDPYGEGWLAILEIEHDELNQVPMLDPLAYFERIKLEAEREVRK